MTPEEAEIGRFHAELAALSKAVEIVCDRKPGAAANAVREDYPEIAALIDGTFLRLEKELEQAKSQQVRLLAALTQLEPYVPPVIFLPIAESARTVPPDRNEVERTQAINREINRQMSVAICPATDGYKIHGCGLNVGHEGPHFCYRTDCRYEWMDVPPAKERGQKERILFVERELAAAIVARDLNHEQWKLVNKEWGQAKERFESHTKAVGTFLSEMRAIMIDPLEDGEVKVAETCAQLLEAAKRDREEHHQAKERERQLRETLTQIKAISDPATGVQNEEAWASIHQLAEAALTAPPAKSAKSFYGNEPYEDEDGVTHNRDED